MQNGRFQVAHQSLADFCRKYGVARLSVFGSVLRTDFDPNRSDLDLLVEFVPGVHKGLFKLVEMQSVLSRLFGRDVDLTTPNSLSKYFRESVVGGAVVLYDAA
jgi:predicted nucleotidyltransferase